MGEFSSGDYAAAADALLQAYRGGDADEVRQCVASRAAFLELDNQARARGPAPHALLPTCISSARSARAVQGCRERRAGAQSARQQCAT